MCHVIIFFSHYPLADGGKIKQKSAQILVNMNSKRDKKPTRGSKNIKTTVKKNMAAGLYMMNMDNVLDGR